MVCGCNNNNNKNNYSQSSYLAQHLLKLKPDFAERDGLPRVIDSVFSRIFTLDGPSVIAPIERFSKLADTEQLLQFAVIFENKNSAFADALFQEIRYPGIAAALVVAKYEIEEIRNRIESISLTQSVNSDWSTIWDILGIDTDSQRGVESSVFDLIDCLNL